MTFTPRQYQIEGRDFLKARRYALLGDAPGVGKTGQALLAIEEGWRTLIICPASVKLQWQKACADWKGWGSLCLTTSNGRLDNCAVTIINYDLIIREKIFKQLLEQRWDLIIYDEAHKLKSLGAKRTKIALGKNGLHARAKRIWFLTGTPIKNRPVDLYPILRSCAPEVLGPYQSFLKFAYRYCGAYKSRFGLDTSGASNIDELRTKLKSFMLRREKRDVLTELPPRVVIKQDLECTPKVKSLIWEEEQKTIEAAGDEDPSMFKLGEIARIRQAIAKYKVPLCVDYIKELLEEEEKLVIFYHHKGVLDELKKSFKGIPHTFVDGSVDPFKRSRIVEEFATRKDVRLFFGQMQACGEGIDGLQRVCSTCVFVEPSWSHTDIEQCIGRLERSGQRSDINIHILTIKDTIESRMMDAVKDKLRVDEQLYKPNTKKEEKTMNEVAELKRIADALEKLVNHLRIDAGPAPDQKANPLPPMPPAKPKTTAKAKPAQEIKQEDEEDVTEDSIRARAADVCALSPDGKAKAEILTVVKKICGGKIADLKTAKQRVQAMNALDSLYEKYNATATSEEEDV